MILKPLVSLQSPPAPEPLILGASRKPKSCEGCPYASTGLGFCPDDKPEKPLIAMMLEAPGQEEVLESRPLVGRAGRMWLWRLIGQNGYKRENVLICNTLRCNPPGNHYPTGQVRHGAEEWCRQYDTKLREFEPDMFLITCHPAMLLRTSAMMRLVQRDVKLAFEFAERGRRPLVLMGDKAKEVFAPWLVGGVKRWRGHWWEGRLSGD